MKRSSIAQAVVGLSVLALSAPAFAGGVPVYEKGDSKLKIETTVFSKLVQNKDTVSDSKTLSMSVDRAYVTLKYNFDRDWLMRITTDVHLSNAITGGTVDTTAPGSTSQPINGTIDSKNNNIFLKYAYLEGKLAGDAAVLRLGQSHTPWIDYEEHLWGHRYFSPVLVDTNGYVASSDLGIGLKGTLSQGLVKYFVTLTNGAGYSHVDRTGKSMDFDSRIGFYPIPGLTLDLQYRNGYKGTKTQPVNAHGTETKHTLYQLMATYGQGHDYRVGANWASEKADPTTGASVTQDAYALWGWTRFSHSYGAFARYEHTTDDQPASSEFKKDHYGLGVEYYPVKHVTLTLGYDQNKKSTGGVTKSKVSQIGLWTEFKF